MTTAYASRANKKQREAILHTDGPLLIIAGPGSGKTFTLVERVVYLITELHVAPEELLVVTFTEKAARELITRVSNRLNEIGVRFNLNEMYIGTFHSICLRLLEDHREFTRLKRNFTLFDEFDQQYFLYQRIWDYRKLPDYELVTGDGSSWAQSEELLKWLNKVTEEAIDPMVLAGARDREVQALSWCHTLYQMQLEEHNALDFANIQAEALRLLESRPEVLAKLRGQLKYLMVDEYQDTNTIQERILSLLMGEARNLCVVGDDDQGLYRFRGATIRNILEFPLKFPAGRCHPVTLSINYRSHPDIIDFYNRWMADGTWEVNGQRFRYAKTIKPPEDEDFHALPTVVRINAPIGDAWMEEVHAFLLRLQTSGQLSDWNQVAFLFRSVKNGHVVALAKYLEQHGIPIYSPRSNQFFDREEVRLLIGAFIFLFPQFPEVRKWDANAHLDIWDYYDENCFRPFAEQLRKPENRPLLAWAQPLIKRHGTLAQPADYAFSGLFYQLLQFPLFAQHLEEEALRGVDKGRAARNLATFSTLLNKFEYLHHISVLNPAYLDKNLRDLFNQFLRFLYDGGIGEYEDDSEYAPSGCVSFLTIHQAKGLEFPVVVVGSLEAGPRKQYTDLDAILENGYLAKPPFEPLDYTKYFDFWRLFYTAFSRAQNLLVLTSFERGGTQPAPSKYFSDRFYALPDWRSPAFQPEQMTFERVKAINLKREYSFTSHITLFENCAEQYRFFKELEFTPIRVSPMLFGTLVHQTIEDVHKIVLRGEAHRVTAKQVETWFQANYQNLAKKERVYLAPTTLKAALGHVMRYVQRESSRWDRIQEAEVDISLVKDEYILTGSVDLIRGERGTVEIVDFKSEKKPDLEKERERLQRYQRQLEVYAHLVEERTGQRVSRMHLYYTGEDSGNPYVSFEKNDKTIARTIAGFDAVVHRIERGDYGMVARPHKMCPDCDIRPYCDNKTWKFKQTP